mmetsp:Transcript_34852/g.63474  ORF Transcript_34852/g.63474 Transcript_34852/m.63474 type:complete len:211 (+) Transcript_34852:564-1196(+)
MVKKEGIAARRLSQSTPEHGAIMKAPIRTSGTEVATRGMELSSGLMKAETTKRKDTTQAESPVRAPSTIPALLSFAMITGLVPRSAPDMVPRAALEKMDLLLGTSPSFSSLAMPIKPNCTPARSNSATKSMTTVPTSMPMNFGPPGVQAEKSIRKAPPKSGQLKTPEGGGESSVHQAHSDIAIMPRMRAPCTLFTSMAEMRTKPARAKFK